MTKLRDLDFQYIQNTESHFIIIKDALDIIERQQLTISNYEALMANILISDNYQTAELWEEILNTLYGVDKTESVENFAKKVVELILKDQSIKNKTK